MSGSLLVLGFHLLCGAAAFQSGETIKSPEGGFTVWFPAKPHLKDTTQRTQLGEVTAHVWSLDIPQASLMVSYADFPANSLPQGSPEELLKGVQNGVAQGLKGRVSDQRSITVGNSPGIEFMIGTDQMNGKFRAVIAGNRLYQLGGFFAKGSERWADVDKVFRSFEITDADAKGAAPEDAAYFPLAEGTWTYVARRKDQELETTWTLTRSRGTRQFKADCWRLEMEDVDTSSSKTALGKKTEILYLSSRPEGILIGDWERKGGDYGYLLKFPLKKGAAWENGYFGAPTMQVSDVLEEVRVPQGTFRCKRIEYVNKYPGWTFATTWWLASGTGIVKIEKRDVSDRGESDRTTIELKGGAAGATAAPAGKAAPAPIPDSEIDARFIQVKLQVAQEHLKAGRNDKATDVLEDLLKTYPNSSRMAEVRKLLEEARK